MASLNKYVFDVKGLLRNYHHVDDDLLTSRQVEFWIVSQRALWANRRDGAYIMQDMSLRQTIIPSVISVDRSFIPGLVPAMYRILRTSDQIPKPINFKSWDGIISAGPVDMAAPRWNHGSYEEAIASGNGRFNRDEIFTFYHNQYIFIISKSRDNYWELISQMAVTGIFEDPRAVGNYVHVTGEACWSADMEYPISLELWAYMKEQIVQGNIDPLLKVPVDRSNDSNDTKNEQP